MIIVFWRSGKIIYHMGAPEGELIWAPEYVCFSSNGMMEALKWMEQLRARRKAGEHITHVCMQSELDEVVGEPGVADAPKDYDWYKRRVDPSIKLGRNSGDELEVPQDES